MIRTRWLLAVLAALLLVPAAPADAQSTDPLSGYTSDWRERMQAEREPLGYLSANPYLLGSTSAPSAEYDHRSPANAYGPYGSAYSRDGARNPYTTGGAEITADDGTYLGRLNSNPYDPESVSNPYGQYGSPYSSTSINNPYSTYGSEYSSQSARNPYTLTPPRLYPPDRRR